MATPTAVFPKDYSPVAEKYFGRIPTTAAIQTARINVKFAGPSLNDIANLDVLTRALDSHDELAASHWRWSCVVKALEADSSVLDAVIAGTGHKMEDEIDPVALGKYLAGCVRSCAEAKAKKKKEAALALEAARLDAARAAFRGDYSQGAEMVKDGIVKKCDCPICRDRPPMFTAGIGAVDPIFKPFTTGR